MKKRIALMLSVLTIFAMMLGGCGTDPTTVDYNGYSYDELYTQLDADFQMVQSISAFLDAYSLSVADLDDHENAEIYDYLLYCGATDAQIDAAGAWDEVSEDFGTCTGTVEDSFTVVKAGNTLTTDITLVFTNEDNSTRDVTFEVVYEYFSMEVTGISINPVYSMGEKLSRAGMNTLISISIVFAVLILISLIIYAFNIFPYLEKKKQEKAARAVSSDTKEEGTAQPEQAQEAQTVTDDTELIAVIAAAIAASEGTSTGDFVVRSINRR